MGIDIGGQLEQRKAEAVGVGEHVSHFIQNCAALLTVAQIDVYVSGSGKLLFHFRYKLFQQAAFTDAADAVEVEHVDITVLLQLSLDRIVLLPKCGAGLFSVGEHAYCF